MKNKVLFIIIFVLVFIAGLQIGRMTVKCPDCAEMALVEDAEDELANQDDPEAYISNKFEGMAASEGFMAEDYKGREISLDSLGGDKTLFVRYSSTGCRPCIDALMGAVKTALAANPAWRCVVIIKGSPMRELYVLGKEYGDRYLFLTADRLPVDFRDSEAPMAFQIIDGKVVNHFTCRYGDEQRTQNYITDLISTK